MQNHVRAVGILYIVWGGMGVLAALSILVIFLMG